ncbi:MAG: 50S ribosomal protein L35 [Candidatus Spechtbacteria bacterium]|nr:50S ribosomal protein L35 [Candidatus Spechtbacteria bacterium]
MPKAKNKNAVLKRFRITRTGKVLHRPVHQDHFNARDPGKKKRQKRRWLLLTGAEAKAIKKLVPYLS